MRAFGMFFGLIFLAVSFFTSPVEARLRLRVAAEDLPADLSEVTTSIWEEVRYELAMAGKVKLGLLQNNERLQERVEALEAEIHTERAAGLSGTLKIATAEEAKLKAEHELRNAEWKISAAATEATSLRAEIEFRRNGHRALRLEFEASEARVAELVTKLSKAEEALDQFVEMSDGLEGERAKLQEELEALRAKLSVTPEIEASIERLKSALDEHEVRIRILEEELGNAYLWGDLQQRELGLWRSGRTNPFPETPSAVTFMWGGRTVGGSAQPSPPTTGLAPLDQ